MAPTPADIVRLTAGTALATLAGGIARTRRARALHPHGTTHRATLQRTGARSGIPWIDTAATDDVDVRLSRGAGIPPPLPDVLGIAIKHLDADVLLSTGGAGPVARHLPRLRRCTPTATYTSIVPYRTTRGPLMLAARHETPQELWFGYSVGTLQWHRFAILTLLPALPARHPATALRFDPMAPPPGLDTYPLVRAVREPAYTRSRAVSGP